VVYEGVVFHRALYVPVGRSPRKACGLASKESAKA
jgi:hypothetical protein